MQCALYPEKDALTRWRPPPSAGFQGGGCLLSFLCAALPARGLLPRPPCSPPHLLSPHWQVVIYLPPDQLAGLDHAGQLASVYVNPGGATCRCREPSQRQQAAATCSCACFARAAAQPRTACVQVSLPSPQPYCSIVHSRCAEVHNDCSCSSPPLSGAGFTVDSFALRTGPGAGSAFVYKMTANSATVQTQG